MAASIRIIPKIYASMNHWSRQAGDRLDVPLTNEQRLAMDRDEQDKSHDITPSRTTPRRVGRRAALARLGLVAGAAYVAPTLMLIQGAGAQSQPPGSGGAGGSGGPDWVKPTKPTKPSKPSPSKQQ